MSNELRLLTVDQLAQHIAILMAARGRDAPILRGCRAPSPDQRDEHSRAFARWLAEAMIEGNLGVALRAAAGSTSGSR